MKNNNVNGFIKKYCGKSYYMLIFSFIFSSLTSIFYLLTPYYILKMLTYIINSKIKGVTINNQIVITTMIYSVVFLFSAIISYLLALFSSHYTAFKLENNIKKFTFKELLNKPLGFFDIRDSGEIRKTIDENAGLTHTFIAHNLPDLFVNTILPITLIIFMFTINWKMGLLTILVPTLSLLFMFICMGIQSKKSGNNVQKYFKALEDMSSNGVEYVRGISVVKMYQNSDSSLSNFKKCVNEYGKWITKYTFSFRTLMVIFSTIVNLSFAVLISYFFLNNDVSNNYDIQLANFIFYVLVSAIFPIRIIKIAHLTQSANILKICVDKINNIVQNTHFQDYGKINEMKDFNIKFENVSFKYNKETQNVLNNISFEAKTGTVTGIIGQSGSGKSTIAKLIPRYYDIEEGKITIGNIDIKDFSKECLMKNISFVFQNTRLFNGTIKENLLIAKNDATDEELFNALNAAHVNDVINKLPDGLNTIYGTDGVFLSGGEQQRIILARAILKNAPIIILDEATAFSDPENEREIQKALFNLTKNKTVIMIAHKLTTIKNADNILILDNGEILKSGNNKYLIENCDIYKNMWEQFNKSLNWKMEVK